MNYYMCIKSNEINYSDNTSCQYEEGVVYGDPIGSWNEEYWRDATTHEIACAAMDEIVSLTRQLKIK